MWRLWQPGDRGPDRGPSGRPRAIGVWMIVSPWIASSNPDGPVRAPAGRPVVRLRPATSVPAGLHPARSGQKPSCGGSDAKGWTWRSMASSVP
ncbi:SPW repeat protein [Streptomyces olivaceus]|uniref:SPW repeat domain-containing protein n=1 Tax=Streptomyces olivaceus TaxID=47716 RepID=UPI0036A14145